MNSLASEIFLTALFEGIVYVIYWPLPRDRGRTPPGT
jgi:hypothetical protein